MELRKWGTKIGRYFAMYSLYFICLFMVSYLYSLPYTKLTENIIQQIIRRDRSRDLS
jgi:hypothetical protein